ncbi:MAG: helix-turn-helix transcriptional regulator [Candidatus Thiodiazotropha sp. (ex Epidulcina cf. delphinae)]|nr:helix-turn-helix transcriptional regulator [Candidatus Thiodiazotropha sp. (ex Epidulcina cf. delphinae)]
MKKPPMYQHKPELAVNSASTGGSLKSTRELRKMTIESVAKKSKIDTEKLISAENGLVKLSLEEIENIAIALDCHPSGLAFPHWSSLPYEPEQIVTTGSVTINKKKEKQELKVYIHKGYGMNVNMGKRKSLTISTFNPSMAIGLRNIDAQIRKRSFSMEGDYLGCFHDVYSSGPDFDADNRILKALNIVVIYDSNGMSFLLSGVAKDEGLVSMNRPPDSPPGDWSFVIEFRVEIFQLRSLFGLYPSAENILIRELSNYS